MANEILNQEMVDTTGRYVCSGDIIMLFNKDSKWSVEKVEERKDSLYSIFPKHMMDVLTNLKLVKPEWIVVIKSDEESRVFSNSIFDFKGNNVQWSQT